MESWSALVSNLSEREIRQAVRRRYAELASKNEPCCPSQTASGTSEVPRESVASSDGCGSPLAHLQLNEGSVVLDLGSGGGIDVFLASRQVGENGRVIGVDSTPEMIFKAREIARKYNYGNVEFRLGEIEHLPMESNSVDAVISNCVINLVPDKARAFKEIYRVLRPGGRIAISDMVALSKPAKDARFDADEWAACIAGAITVGEYEKLLNESGFDDIKYLEEGSCCPTSLPVKSVTWLARKL